MSDEFIVLVKVKDSYSLYTSTEPDIWVIDNAAYSQAFIDAGYDLSHINESYERYSTGILSASNLSQFLEKIESQKVEPEFLNELIASTLPTDDWWSISPFMPKLIYDFDQSKYCSYHEQHIFDKFIPAHWSTSESLLEGIPQKYKYWIVNGENILKKEWKT